MTTEQEQPTPSSYADSDSGHGDTNDELAVRLRAIDDASLAQRAESYVQLHDEMRDRLEGGDAPHTQGE